ncbi:MAG: MarR family transcriptional regulator [Candidatus Dormiibacterota bacterium]
MKEEATADRGADPGTEINLALRALVQAGHDMNVALAQRLGIGVTDAQAMGQLVGSPSPLGPVELGNRLGIRSASATTLVDRLEAAGHLRRERHPKDRRRVTLQLTETGRAEIRRALTPLVDRVAELTRDLDAAEAETVRRFLRDAARVLHDFGAGGEAIA